MEMASFGSEKFVEIARDSDNVGAYRVSGTDDIWNAVRHFFGRASEVSP